MPATVKKHYKFFYQSFNSKIAIDSFCLQTYQHTLITLVYGLLFSIVHLQQEQYINTHD